MINSIFPTKKDEYISLPENCCDNFNHPMTSRVNVSSIFKNARKPPQAVSQNNLWFFRLVFLSEIPDFVRSQSTTCEEQGILAFPF